MGRAQFDPRVAIGLAAILLLLAAIPYGLTQDDWWPGIINGRGYYPIRSGDDYAAAADSGVDPRNSALYIGLASIEVAGGRPRLVSYRGDLPDASPLATGSQPVLEEMLGSVLDTTERESIPTDIIAQAQSEGLFAEGPGGVLISSEPSPSSQVLVVSQSSQVHVMPLEWLDTPPWMQQ